MALNATVLKALIKSKVESKNPPYAANIGDTMDWLYEAVAEAVVEHVVSAAQVTVLSVSGVTTGAGTSGPGTGTIG